MQAQQYNGLINKDKFAYRSILGQDNLILNKYASQSASQQNGYDQQSSSNKTPPKYRQSDVFSFNGGKHNNLDIQSDNVDNRRLSHQPSKFRPSNITSINSSQLPQQNKELEFFRQKSLKKAENSSYLQPTSKFNSNMGGSPGLSAYQQSSPGSPGLISSDQSKKRSSLQKQMTIDRSLLGGDPLSFNARPSSFQLFPQPMLQQNMSMGLPIPAFSNQNQSEIFMQNSGRDSFLQTNAQKQRKTSLNYLSVAQQDKLTVQNSVMEHPSSSDVDSSRQNGEQSKQRRGSNLGLQRKNIQQSNNIIDLEQPGYKHVETFKSVQNDMGFKSKFGNQSSARQPKKKSSINMHSKQAQNLNNESSNDEDESKTSGDDELINISPAKLKRNNTTRFKNRGQVEAGIMMDSDFDREIDDEDEDGSSFKSESYDSESDSEEDSSKQQSLDEDMVLPGKAFIKKRKKINEVDAAKQFMMGSSSLTPNNNQNVVSSNNTNGNNNTQNNSKSTKKKGGVIATALGKVIGRRLGVIQKNKTFKTELGRQDKNGGRNNGDDMMGMSDQEQENSQSEDDSLKSEMNTVEMNQYDNDYMTERAEFGDAIKTNRTSNQLNRGNTQFKRQQIHLSKSKFDKVKNSKTKKSTKKTKEEKVKRKKSRMLKRMQTLFKGDQQDMNEDSNYLLDEQIMKDSQKLRDIYKFNKCIILPDDKFKERWEILVTVLLLFTAVVTPYRIAFIQNDDLAWTVVDNFTDGIFFVDVILNFFTAYQDINDELITSRKRIAITYLKSWFLIDVISVIPITQFLEIGDYTSLARLARLPKLYRLIKMFKLSRILKVIKERATISKYLNEVLKVSVGFERLSFFVLIFIISVHIVSCFWVILASLQENVLDTWVYLSDMQNAPETDLYLAAFYFTIVIVTTIGYGDIVVRTPVEQVFCIMLLVVGVVSFSFAIGSLSSILSSLDAKAAKLKEKLQILNEIQTEYRIPYELFRRLRLALRYDHSKNSQEQINFLNELPQNLKVELSLVMHQELIKSVKFFKKKQPHFIAFVGPMLKPIKVEKEQYIYKEGDPIDEIYFLVSGQAGYALNKHEDQVYVIIDKGYYFGEIDFIFMDDNGENDGKRKFSAKAIEDSDLLVLNKQDLLLADQEFEDVVSDLFKNAMHRLKRTSKIKKESIKFYEKQQRFMAHTGQAQGSQLPGFQARLSQAPRTRSNFFFQKTQEDNNDQIKSGKGSIAHSGNNKNQFLNQNTLMPNMQQIDDGELDLALASSDELLEQQEHFQMQKHSSLQQSYFDNSNGLNKSDKQNKEILMKTSDLLFRQGSKFSQMSKTLKTFEEDKINQQDYKQNDEDEDSQNNLDQSVDLSQEEAKSDEKNKRNSMSSPIQKKITVHGQPNQSNKHSYSSELVQQKTKSKFQTKLTKKGTETKINLHGKSSHQTNKSSQQMRNHFAQKMLNSGQSSTKNQLLNNNLGAGGQNQQQLDNISNNNNINSILATEESDGRQGKARWNALKQTLNKKVQQVKSNQFQVPIMALQMNNKEKDKQQQQQEKNSFFNLQLQQLQHQHQQQTHPGQQFTQFAQNNPSNQSSTQNDFTNQQFKDQQIGFSSQANTANQTKLLQIEQNNRVLYSQINDRIDKFEQTLDKINNLITVLSTNNNNIQSSENTAEQQRIITPQLQMIQQENISQQSPNNFTQSGNNTEFKEMIKKMIQDAYINKHTNSQISLPQIQQNEQNIPNDVPAVDQDKDNQNNAQS